MKSVVRLCGSLVIALMLQACSGGGGGQVQLIGQFVDDPVEGLTYQCTGGGGATTSGLTNAQGQFNYQTGQACTFSVGKVVVGSLSNIPADGLVTPQDVAGVARTATSSPAVTAIAQFLQSLSEPGSSGKIKISANTTTALSNIPEVKLLDTAGPIAQDTLRSLITSVGKTMVTPAQAAANLDTGITKSGVSKTGGLVTVNTPKAISSVSVSAPSGSQSTLAAGDALKLTAMANWTDGSGSVVDGTVSWSSSDTGVAMVASDGTVTSLKPGTVKISVSKDKFAGSLELTVSEAVLKSLSEPTGLTESLPLGASRSLSLVGTYSDGTQKTLTSGVNWTVSSADASKASVDQGALLAKATGDVEVTASIGSVSKTFKLTVTPAVLRSLAISRSDGVANSTAVAAGRTVQLKATGTYSDGSTQDLSSTVAWTASASDRLSVATGGLVTTSKAGSSSVTVSDGPTGISAQAELTVGAAELAALSITAPSRSLALGLNQTLSVTGTYSDNTTSTNLTGVQWTSSDANKASVASNGLVTSLAQGAVRLTATVGGVSKDFEVTVTEPVAKELTLSSVLSTIANGATTTLNALAKLTNDAVVAVAKSVNWVVESLGGNAVITISGDTVTLKGTEAGDIRVKGEYQGIFANFRMSVTPTLSGVAAVGAPIESGAITVHDATGAVVGSGTTGSGGAFSVQLTVHGTAPYTLKLVKDEITLHALHTVAASGVVNITPLSDAVVAMVSPTGSADGLVSALQNRATSPTKAVIDQKREVIQTALSPVAAAAGFTGNLFTDEFTANGKGKDKLLDSISVVATADGVSKSANIQMVVKVATDPINATSQLPVVNLTSQTSIAQANSARQSLGTFTANDLTPDNAAALYDGLLANLNACYREPPSVRTDGVSVVRSDACKKVFLNNDPTQYLNFGQRLGSTAQFAGLFTYPGAVEFKPVAKPYLVQDLMGTRRGDGIGRAIVALSWVNEHGNRENIMLYVTKYTNNGQEMLGLSGDRNIYPWSVSSHTQLRTFPLKSDRSLDYVQSSYLIAVRDLIRNGKSVVNYVTVTTPTQKKVLLASPLGGASRDLAICRSVEVNLGPDNQPTTPKNTEISTYPASGAQAARPKYHCSGISKSLTFAQRFISTAETRLPSDIRDVGILRPLNDSGEPYTPDSETLARYPSMGMWSIEYTFMDGTRHTQRTWSVARPMTVEEMLGPNGPGAVMPDYTPATMAAIKALKTQPSNLLTACFNGDPTCDPLQSPVPAPETGGFQLAWTDSAVPMTSLWISGRRNEENNTRTWISGTNATSWDDQLNVRSTMRSAEVKCSRQSDTDAHCKSSVPVNGLGDFHPRTWMTYSELWGKDAEQRSLMRSYNWYQPRKLDGSPF